MCCKYEISDQNKKMSGMGSGPAATPPPGSISKNSFGSKVIFTFFTFVTTNMKFRFVKCQLKAIKTAFTIRWTFALRNNNGLVMKQQQQPPTPLTLTVIPTREPSRNYLHHLRSDHKGYNVKGHIPFPRGRSI